MVIIQLYKSAFSRLLHCTGVLVQPCWLELSTEFLSCCPEDVGGRQGIADDTHLDWIQVSADCRWRYIAATAFANGFEERLASC